MRFELASAMLSGEALPRRWRWIVFASAPVALILAASLVGRFLLPLALGILGCVLLYWAISLMIGPCWGVSGLTWAALAYGVAGVAWTAAVHDPWGESIRAWGPWVVLWPIDLTLRTLGCRWLFPCPLS